MQAGGTPAGPSVTAALAGEVARAEQVAAAVRAELAQPRPDPVAALRRLQEVGTRLDRALASVRDAAQTAERARSALDQAITRARAEISVVAQFVATRRGAVGREARTRLAEAQRHLEQALALAPSDPEAALAEAERADALAERAGHLAKADVDQWSMPGGGPFAGGGGVGGAVLGGILLGGVLGGGGGMSGGFGGVGDSVAVADGAAGCPADLAAAAAGAVEADSKTVGQPARRMAARQDGAHMAQQSILGRITQMARANINALLDQAEDPEQMLDQMIRDYTTNIGEAQEAVAQTIGNLRLTEEDAQEAGAAAGGVGCQGGRGEQEGRATSGRWQRG